MNDEPLDSPQTNTVLSVALVAAVIVILVAVLPPVFRPYRHISQLPTCPSSMKQIGNAIKMYLSDWDDTYPTNRPYYPGHKLGPIRAYVKLSPPDPLPGQSEPARFLYSLNWVEGLYNHIESITKSTDPQSVWRCPYASSTAYPRGSKTAAVNYVFNRNLVEQPEGIIKGASTLMMVREIGALVNSELRPTNNTTWSSKTPPISPFLTDNDARIGRTTPQLHGSGSHILFADGHVKVFDADFFPCQEQITKSNCWDSQTKQWYNYAPGSAKPKHYIGAITITP